MLISRRQKAIIRKICKAQERSFMRILNSRISEIRAEMEEDGYIVSESDVLEQIAIDMQQWDDAKNDPVKFINLLDDKNIDMIKHHLVNSFLNNPDSKPIWAKINIYHQANEHLN